MPEFSLQTPVAFLIFNRPDTTERVFNAIAQAKPSKLLVIADGPRAGRVGEAERCAQARAVIERVDWECEVLTNYADSNMGCKMRVATGIDWVFQQVEEAIILEDDCLPEQSFFRFCQEMLERYRHHPRVGMVTGGNLQFGQQRGDASYYFSRYSHIWGWATWRRAWQLYQREIPQWPAFREQGWLNQLFETQGERDYWATSFQLVHEGKLDTWDCSWTFATLTHGLLQVVPNVNLISNIGFGPDATHTHVVGIHADMPTSPIHFPLKHPDFILANAEADRYISNDQIAPSFMRRQLRRVKRILRMK